LQIIGQAISIPERRVSNREITEEVRHQSSRHLPANVLDHVIAGIEEGFSRAGCGTRSRRGNRASPLEFIREAFDRSLAFANANRRHVSAVIYCSIHRSHWEPSSASILCKDLGLRPKRAFDVLDACMGWATAMETARGLFATQSHDIVAIIASEFAHEVGGAIYPSCYTFEHESELAWKFAGLTMGEAASVTLISHRDSDPEWCLLREEQPELAHLSLVPIRGAADANPLTGEAWIAEGVGGFIADATGLMAGGYRPSQKILQDYNDRYGIPDLIIPHSVSTALPRRLAAQFGLDNSVFTTFSEFGNLATASIPVNMHSAICRERFMETTRSVAWIASAGMKFAACDLPVSSELFKKIVGR